MSMNNEELLQKLRDFHKEKTIELKNRYPDKQVDLKDIQYCGQIEIEEKGEKVKKDVYLATIEVDGKLEYIYCTDKDEIARDIPDLNMIIPVKDYKENDFSKQLKDDKNRQSLNELEKDRINNISKTLGMNSNEITAASEMTPQNLNNANKKLDEQEGKPKINEEEILRKNVNIKTELNPHAKITASESFGDLIPGANKYSKIAVVYADRAADKFKVVGITNDGKVEELDALQKTEGSNPTQNVVQEDRLGENVKETTVSAMYRIKGRPNEGFTMSYGSVGCVEINYYRRSNARDGYQTIPVESTHTRYVKSEMKRDIDKTKNVRVDEEVDKAENELREHKTDGQKVDHRNINDNPYDDVKHDNIIRTKNGEEKTFDEAIKEISQKQKVSEKEAERLFYKNKDEGETYEKVLEDVDEEVNEQYRGSVSGH